MKQVRFGQLKMRRTETNDSLSQIVPIKTDRRLFLLPVLLENQAVPPNQETDVAQVVESSNEFAAAIYSKIALDVPGDLFLSPSSVTLAMAMTFAGAGCQTAKEMAKVLRFSLPENRLHDAFRELQDTTRMGGVELRIANRLWGQRGYHFLTEFLGTCNCKYGAGFADVDFQGPVEAVCREINDWVADQTCGRISNLVAPGTLDEMTRLVLTNAIYFLGCWEYEFDEAKTTAMPFWTGPNANCLVPMMRQTDYFRYGEFEELQVLELPYREQQIELKEDESGHVEVVESLRGGSDLVMTALLPRTLDGLKTIESRLSAAALKKWLALDQCRVRVYLPKFRTESTLSLVEPLMEMGMRAAFSRDDADFSRMSDNPEGLYIAAAIHKAFVDVNEKGTEAAAATAVVMAGRGVSREPDPKLFRADHPFLFLIRDRKTGLIHFMGRMSEALLSKVPRKSDF